MSTSRLVAVLLLAVAPALAWAQASLPKHERHQQGEFSFETGPAPEFVAEHEIPGQWQEVPDPAPVRWRNWLIDSQLDRRPGRDIEFHDYAYQPVTAELVSEAAKHTIEFNPLYQQLTLHRVEVRRDGKWSSRLDPAKVSLARRESGFEKDLSDGEVTALIVLQDVRVNDVVRVSFSIAGSNPIIAGSQEDTFHMARADGLLDRYVRVLYPASTVLGVRSLGTKLSARPVRVGDHQEVVAHVHQVAGIRNEGDYPNWYSPYPRIQVAPKRNWSEVVSWALPLYPDPGELPAELQQRLAAWKQIADPYARAFAVLRTVQDEVRYFGTELGDNTHRPSPPAQTWKNRYGDCKDKAYLTSVLLRRLGFEAEPALVSMRRGKAIQEMLPSAALFDHVIVRMKVDGETFWLDPTLTQQRGGLRTLDLADYGAALPVVAGTADLVVVTAPATTNNSATVVERFAPSEAGDAIDLLVRTEYTGQRAEAMRRRVNSEGAGELSRLFAEYYRKRYGELVLVAPLSVEDQPVGDRLVFKEHYSLKDGWVGKQGTTRQIDIYADGLASDAALPASVQRSGPLGLAHPAVLKQEISVVLPAGWTTVELPEPRQIKTGQFSYRRDVTSTPQQVLLSHRFEVLANEVPEAGVGSYVRNLRDVGDAIGIRLGVRTTAAAGNSDRDQRLKQLLRNSLDAKGDAK
jgi:hypothetical protein